MLPPHTPEQSAPDRAADSAPPDAARPVPAPTRPVDLRVRRREPEWMDDPAIDEGLLAHALDDLARINRLCGTARRLAAEVAGRRPRGARTLRVLDAGCGGGEVTIELERRVNEAARRHGARGTVEVVGCDLSPTAIDRATRLAAAAGSPVRFMVRDLVRHGIPDGFDGVVSSLFLHHLDDEDAQAFLGSAAERAGAFGVIDDLVRARVAHAATGLALRVLSRSPVVRVDGPRSVRGAFTPGELTRMAASAGLPGASVRRVRPFRMLLTWRRR